MIRKPLVTLLAVAGLAACASLHTVESFKAPERDVSGLRTYAWKDGEFGLPLVQDPALLEQARGQLRSAVDVELRAKGYVQAAAGANPDFVVSYSVSGQRRFATADNTRIGAPSPNQVLTPGEIRPPPASSLPREVTVREGTIAIYANDPSSGSLLWRGSVDIEQRIGSSAAGVRLITRLARDIAREFPAHAGGG